MRKTFFALIAIALAQPAFAAEWLLKSQRRVSPQQLMQELHAAGQPVVDVKDMRFNGWYLIRTATEAWTAFEANNIGRNTRGAMWVEPNKRLRAYGMPALNVNAAAADPELQVLPPRASAPDPMAAQQWGLEDSGLNRVANRAGNPQVIVAVIDTGVDYNHPDLNPNIWINPGEAGAKANNGIDDDGNGYIDDYMGWDFVENDNKPWDKTGGFFGNPGHGTHCAGVIGAASNNGFGISGIAPGVRIMPLRFLSERGEGTTADALRAVKYATDMGAWITSNSWGGPDDDPAESKALQEVFADASAKGRLIIAAAGNESFNVDSDPRQAAPASYNMPTQITVAATDRNGRMASFSNYGAKLVHVGAPGVGILSTVPNGKFMNMDGTSMAAPMVSGAVALYWSQNPQMSAMAVKNALMASVKPTPALQGKTITGGRLDIEALLKVPAFRR